MPIWASNLIVLIMTKLTSWLLAKGLEQIHSKQVQTQSDKDIDSRLQSFKQAYSEAFNGEPVTTEQREKLKKAISDFIRGDGSGGL